MGLKDTFKAAAETTAQAFGDVFTSAVYEAEATTVYDVSAGTTSIVSSRYLVSMLFSKYKSMEIDGSMVKPTDIKGIIPQNNLTPAPDLNDRVIRVEAGASVVYEIRNIQQDPADAIWKFQLRKA